MRRKKKLILNIAKILLVILIAIGIFLIFKPKKKINTANTAQNGKELIKVNPVDESNIKITLPETIKEYTTNKAISKDIRTFAPLVTVSERYLIPILANNEITVLVGDDSASLLSANSPIQIGNEYMVSGIEETIEAVYYFTVEGYDYPVLLLLGQSCKLYYVDIQRAYSSGNFAINGYIENIPDVQNVYQAEATENGKTTRTAIIVCTNGEGYEFSTNMIGR